MFSWPITMKVQCTEPGSQVEIKKARLRLADKMINVLCRKKLRTEERKEQKESICTTYRTRRNACLTSLQSGEARRNTSISIRMKLVFMRTRLYIVVEGTKASRNFVYIGEMVPMMYSERNNKNAFLLI